MYGSRNKFGMTKYMISPVKIWRRQSDIRAVLGKRGQIISWTRVSVPGTDFKAYAPYFVVLVKLENGDKVFGQIVDYTESTITVGAQVIATLRKVRQPTEEGVIVYGIKFKLL